MSLVLMSVVIVAGLAIVVAWPMALADRALAERLSPQWREIWSPTERNWTAFAFWAVVALALVGGQLLFLR